MIMTITCHLHNQPLFPSVSSSSHRDFKHKIKIQNQMSQQPPFSSLFPSKIISSPTTVSFFFYFICQKISGIFVRFFLPMDVRSCTNRSLTSLLLIVFLVLINVEKQNVSADSSSDDDALLCGTDLSSFLPLPYSNLQNMVCKRLWNSFMLRYSHAEGNVITIVLSTTYTSGWVGMGFSRDGMMLNSSCMVGWITPEGRSRIKQYYIEGFTPSEIKPDKGELPLTSVPPYLAIEGASIYLAFQLKFATPINRQPILLAYSSKYPQHHHLTIHDDKTTLYLDFSSGHSAGSSSAASADYGFGSMKKTHGVLSLLGWGLFLPCGAILARYLRHKEPLWYYLHVAIQFLGFILGISAIVVGLSLNHRLQAHITAHKTIGIFVLVFVILQVMAFFARPNKDSKNRKYWNLYHFWIGRIAIFLAAVNILLGIHIGGEGSAWKIGYGFVLGFIITTCIVLEALSRLRRSNDPAFPPNFQMNNI